MITIISVVIIDRVKKISFYLICKTAVENKIDLPTSSVTDQHFKNAFVVEEFSA